jgi:hypothetical protein
MIGIDEHYTMQKISFKKINLNNINIKIKLIKDIYTKIMIENIINCLL